MDPSARDHLGVDEVGLAELIERIADLDRRYEDALCVSLDSASTAADRMDLVFSVIHDGEADSIGEPRSATRSRAVSHSVRTGPLR